MNECVDTSYETGIFLPLVSSDARIQQIRIPSVLRALAKRLKPKSNTLEGDVLLQMVFSSEFLSLLRRQKYFTFVRHPFHSRTFHRDLKTKQTSNTDI